MAKADILQRSNAQKLTFGDYGLRILSAAETSVAGEYFSCLHCNSAAVVDFTSSPDDGGGDTTITNLSIPAGFAVYGNLTTVTVDSGEVVAYLREF